MGFVIEGAHIDFKHFQELIKYEEDLPFVSSIVEFLTLWYDDSIEYIEMKTSGSTGTPKSIFHSKKAMLTSAELTADYFMFMEGQSALLCLPVSFVAGKMMMVRAIHSKLKLHLIVPSSNPLAELKEKINFLPLTPQQLYNSDTTDWGQLGTVLLGGGKISQSLRSKILTHKLRAYEGYGMTETLTHVALREITENVNVPFKALDNIRLSIDNRQCLVIEADHFGTVTTNDLVDLLTDATFEWLGRYDNVINTGGIKVFPEQVEASLASLILKPFFIAGIHDAVLGHRIVLLIESSDSFDPNILKKAAITKYQQPKEVYLCSSFERTKSGKINRQLTLNKLNRFNKLSSA